MVNGSQFKIARLMLVIFVLQLVLPLVIFSSVLIVKHIQKEAIFEHFADTAYFTRLSFSDKAFSMLNIEGNELHYKNALFDIHSVKKEPGKYILLVLADKNEAILQKVNKNIANSEKPLHGKLKNIVFNFMYFQKAKQFNFIVANSKHIYAKIFINKFNSPQFKIPYPPPDLS